MIIEDKAFSSAYDLAPPPPPVSKLFRRHKKTGKERHPPDGKGGGGGAKSYDIEKAGSSINHSLLSGLQRFSTNDKVATVLGSIQASYYCI
jgi:hypothetical protein